MELYILRHGETNLNKEEKMSCSDVARLNETGFKQAEKAGEMLEDIYYDVIISSPYVRTKITAEIANRNRKPIIMDNRIVERNAGVLEGKLLKEINLKSFNNYYENAEYEGAERIQDFCIRVWGFLDEIKEKYKNQTVLLVTHNIVISAIKAYILGMPASGDMRNLWNK